MRALQAVSFDIKTKHKSARRNILYDDERMELVLDFSLGEGEQWRRVYSGQALDRKRAGGDQARSGMRDSELDDLLGRVSDHGDSFEGPTNGARMGFGGDP